jgi:hypothetical protein
MAVALVCVGDSSARALALISGIVHEAACPGIFVYITDGHPEEL